MNKALSFILKEEVLAELDAYAEEDNYSRSQAIQNAIVYFLKNKKVDTHGAN